MLAELMTIDPAEGAAAERAVGAAADAYLAETLASRGRGDRGALIAAEADVRSSPARCFRWNASGEATLYAAGTRYAAGQFSTPSIGVLRQLAAAAQRRSGGAAGRVRLWIFDGASIATDIGALQAVAPPRALFQVASQFNCLESPGPYVVDVADYLHDPTQGPRASVGAFPGTLLRHYAAPDRDGHLFVQSTDGAQINLLAAVCGEGVATVRGGYLLPNQIVQPTQFAQTLEERADAIAVGVHDGIQVVLGAEWDGGVTSSPHRTIAHVLTSTVAAGMYGDLDGDRGAPMSRVVRSLQRAAYLGTLLAAAALGKDIVVLTLIGGGVFGNPVTMIWDAIQWAMDQVTPCLHRDLCVVLNGRNLGQQIAPDALRRAAQARGGRLVRFDGSRITV